MPSSREIVLCRYRYDPLDRLVGTSPLVDAESQRFYCKSRLATEIQGQVQHSIFQHDDQLLAQQWHSDDALETTLLATDQQRSVLHTLGVDRSQPITYSPYGHRPAENGLLSLLGFNGERQDPVTGHYLLGNGYRAFNPVLMRFNSPDSWSPFGDGGLNAYAYCLGDPVNRLDRSGHVSLLGSFIKFAENLTNTRISTIASSSSTIKALQGPAVTAKQATPYDIFNNIIERISKSPLNEQQRALLKKSEELSKSKTLQHQIAPGRMRSAEEVSERFNFYNRHPKEFSFTDGVPQVGEPQLLPNGPDTYLHTGHFDTAIVYYANQMRTSSGPELKTVATKLRTSVINRADYIVSHTKESARDSVRPPRGRSPVRY
jgi:RHS repeat-associated protein